MSKLAASSQIMASMEGTPMLVFRFEADKEQAAKTKSITMLLLRLESNKEQAARTGGGSCVTRRHQIHDGAPLGQDRRGLCVTRRHQNPSRRSCCVSKQTKNRQPGQKGDCVRPVVTKSITIVFESDDSNCKCQSRDSVAAPETSEVNKRLAKVETEIWSGRKSVVLLYVLVVLETLSVPDATSKEITREPSRPERIYHFLSPRQNNEPQTHEGSTTVLRAPPRPHKLIVGPPQACERLCRVALFRRANSSPELVPSFDV